MIKLRNLSLPERLKIYSETQRLSAEGLPMMRIANRLNISYSTVWFWSKRGKRPGNNFLVPDFTPSPDLSYIIGVIYGDGFLTSKWQIGLQSNDRDFCENFAICLSKVLKRHPPPIKIYKRDNWQFYRTCLKNRCLFEYLQDKNLHKDIIDQYPAEFLRGFFDSEGDCGKSGNTIYVRVVNTNKNLLDFIRALLQDKFGIHSTISLHWRKGLLRFIRGRKVISQIDGFKLAIYRRKDIEKYHAQIGFSIRRKREKLEQILVT
jgi:DNA endonuclease related to intein-encoded endonucleases